jgi:hypothetical protein
VTIPPELVTWVVGIIAVLCSTVVQLLILRAVNGLRTEFLVWKTEADLRIGNLEKERQAA